MQKPNHFSQKYQSIRSCFSLLSVLPDQKDHRGFNGGLTLDNPPQDALAGIASGYELTIRLKKRSYPAASTQPEFVRKNLDLKIEVIS